MAPNCPMWRDSRSVSFPWASSERSDFNYDFHFTIDSVAPVEYNYQDQAKLEPADVA